MEKRFGLSQSNSDKSLNKLIWRTNELETDHFTYVSLNHL